MTRNFFLILSLLVLSGCTTAYISDPLSDVKTVGEVTVHFINVGQGDSTLIQSDSGEAVLIDTGSPAGGPEVVRYLKALGISKINHLIHTHSHDDHMGGVFSVLSAFEVDYYYDNGFSNFDSAVYGDYITKVRQDLSKYHLLQAGERIIAGGITIDVLNPLLPPSGNINEDSLVVRVRIGDVNVLLAGDMGNLGERRLLQAGTGVASRVIRIAHHGEDDACSDEFLKEVNPDIAVISVSRINRYARPHPDLLSRLDRAGITVYRTDLNGHVVFRSDGRTYSITSEH